MPDTKHRVNTLALRKRLLIAESEINRNMAFEEGYAMADDFSTMLGKIKTFTGTAPVLLSLLSALTTLKPPPPEPTATKSSWLHKITMGTRIASSIMLLIESYKKNSTK